MLSEIESVLQQEKQTFEKTYQPMSESEMDQFIMETILVDDTQTVSPEETQKPSESPKSNQVCY